MTLASEDPPKILSDEKPTIVKYITQSDKMNEPPPQPRVRKVTTITNTLAVVVRRTENEVGVWVLTSCQEKTLPIIKPHLFVNLKLGTWMTVGIYPDGSLASFSPWSFYLQAYQTVVHNNIVYMERKASEFRFEKRVTFQEIRREIGDPHQLVEINRNYANLYDIPGFGHVLAHPDVETYINLSYKSGANDHLWIQWCGEASRNYCWTMNSYIQRAPADNELSEKQLREFSELVRNKNQNEVFPPSANEVVVRQFGLITDVNVEKKTASCWSPRVSMEADHVARIPQPKHREVDSPMLPPLIGQWIQFDLPSCDIEKFMNNQPGNRLNIPEYLPITSPAGVAVAHVNKVIRMMISCILVKGTDHPNLFELPHYGFVIDRKASLISGTHVQLVLEKTSPRVRKSSGVCWLVEESMVVSPDDVTVEKLQELSVVYVPMRDAMEVSHIVAIEKPDTFGSSKMTMPFTNNNVSSNGVTCLKYQQPPQYFTNYQPRHDFYSGSTIQIGINDRGNISFQPKRKAPMTFTGATMEGHAIVEKVHSQNQSGILWMVEMRMSCYFIYSDDFPLSIGDYAQVKLVQKPDSTAKNGFKWMWQGGTKKKAPFILQVKATNILIQDIVEFHSYDKVNRAVFGSNLFPSIVDANNLVVNPQVNRKITATITRRKIQNANSDLTSFHWILCNVSQFHNHMVPAYSYRAASRYVQPPSHAIIESVRTPPPSDTSSISPTAPSVVTTSSDE